MTSKSSSPLIGFQTIEKLFPKSFFNQMIPDMGIDGIARGKGSLFAQTVSQRNSTLKNTYYLLNVKNSQD
jgi:hypothetical protein